MACGPKQPRSGFSIGRLMNVEGGKNAQTLHVNDVLPNISLNIHFFLTYSYLFALKQSGKTWTYCYF